MNVIDVKNESSFTALIILSMNLTF